MSPTESYILDVLEALGQMDHISGRVTCAEDHAKPKHPAYQQNGVLKMPADVRRELVARGWELLAAVTYPGCAVE